MLRSAWPGARVEVLPPPAGPGDEGLRQQIRDGLGLGSEDFLLAAPSALIREAGHKQAIWAAAIVREIHPHLRMVIPGRGDDEPRIRFFAEAAAPDGLVTFTGGRLALGALLAACDAAIFAHLRDVGMASLAAAMATGLGVVASSTPDIASSIPDGEAALLSPPGDPCATAANLLRLVDRPPLVGQLGAAARRLAVERFAPQVARERLGEIYEQAAAPTAR